MSFMDSPANGRGLDALKRGKSEIVDIFLLFVMNGAPVGEAPGGTNAA
jgi:hypothetical protein